MNKHIWQLHDPMYGNIFTNIRFGSPSRKYVVVRYRFTDLEYDDYMQALDDIASFLHIELFDGIPYSNKDPIGINEPKYVRVNEQEMVFLKLKNPIAARLLIPREPIQ